MTSVLDRLKTNFPDQSTDNLDIIDDTTLGNTEDSEETTKSDDT